MARRERAPSVIPAVLFGESASAVGPLRLAAGEDGMISLAAVLAVLFFLVLIALVGNVGVVVNHKIESQNAADAVTISSARQTARGLNSITAANHLLGELLSLVALQEAIGGKFKGDDEGYPAELQGRLDDLRKNGADADKALDELEPIYMAAATNAGEDPDDSTFEDVHETKEKVTGDNMLLDSRVDLKNAMVKLYTIKTAGMLLIALGTDFPFPVVGQVLQGIGYAIVVAVQLVEIYVDVEWQMLRLMEKLAKNTSKLREELFDLLPYIRQFELDVRDRTPELTTQTAKAVGERNGGSGVILPKDGMTLYVVDDPARPDDGDSFQHSQVVRATFPWVNFNRQPILKLTGWMVFSHAKNHYRDWSDLMTLQKSRELYDKGSYLLMLIDSAPEQKSRSAPDQKGGEVWTQDPSAAEQMFTMMGFTRRPPPKLWSPGFFPAVNRDGYTAFAQAIVYNANAQSPDRAADAFQPEIGWDTLNWSSPVGESNALEYRNDDDNSGCPKIRLNWQAKLMPVTRLSEAIAQPPDPALAPVLDRLDPNSPLSHTH